jgi:uncharacterized DUF497 family protein
MSLDFEWDEEKARLNLAKHGVSFALRTRVFVDPRWADIDVSRGRDKEIRRKAVGRIDGKLYAVVYTDRAGVRRLISARRTNRTEEKSYNNL